VVTSGGDVLWTSNAALTPRRSEPREDTDISYIIFTSGSTGAPKGISHTHQTALAYVRMSAALYGVTAEDRLSNHSPLHFDMSTFDMFTGAYAGATTVIIPEPHMKLPASLAKLISDEALTIWYSVPSAIIQLVERGVLEDHDIASLRWVIFGGEPMLPNRLKEFTAHAPNATYSNNYGPAETNQCMVRNFAPNELDGTSPIPIGQACEHATLLILDNGEPAETGELYVASTAQMQGYWNDPVRNGAVFHDLTSADGKRRRFYATGDIVRPDASGDLHFVGRVDRQVKLRGFRIELDEVELTLAKHASLSEVAAVLPKGAPHLVAFATLRPGAETTEADLLGFARAALPPYAVPGRIEILPSFPRTGTGKIDRKTLAKVSHD
jgi:amino acid adenylation domain-containing protein